MFFLRQGVCRVIGLGSIFEGLAKETKVIRYSRIGNGHSDNIQKNYTSEQYAQEAFLLLSALNIEQPVVYVAYF